MNEEKRNDLPKEVVEPADKPPAGYERKSSPVPSPLQVPARRRKRTMVYVDGFNLYYGMHDKFGRKYLWLDLWALSQRLMKDDQELVGVKYFSASMRDDPDAAARQSLYLGALKTTGVRVILGRFQEKTMECKGCRRTWRSYEEKESDVNFCVTLLDDALAGSFDVALLITGDSDMTPAVRLAKKQRQGLRFVSVFPPNRFSGELKTATDASMHLGATPLRQSQLPERVVGAQRTYLRPTHWR